MIEIIDRTPFAPVFRRTGPASFFFEMEVDSTGKKTVKQMRYTDQTLVSRNVLVEPAPTLLWADPGGTIRLTDSMVKQINALGPSPDPAAVGAIVGNPENQVPKSPAWNSELEALLITALQAGVVIPSVETTNENGLYTDLRLAGLLDQFDIGGMARFLAGIGVVKNSITLENNRTVNLTSLIVPETQPVASQLEILTLEPLWNLIESLGFYGLLPYVWSYGLIDFKTFCDRVQMYFPSPDDRARFVFQELTQAIIDKTSTALTENQVDQLMKPTITQINIEQ